MFEAVQLAEKGPAIVINQEYIWDMFNMDSVAFNFLIEENIFIKKKRHLYFCFWRGKGKAHGLSAQWPEGHAHLPQ